MRNVSGKARNGQKRSLNLHAFKVAKVLSLSLLGTLSACNLSSGGLSGEESCEAPYTKVINPIDLKGHKHIYFSVQDLKFLLDEADQIRSIRLDLQVSGKHQADPSEVSIAFNGLSGTAASNELYYLPAKYDSKADESGLGFHLHKMKLNGASPVMSLMTNIVKNKGEVKISAQGKSISVVSAKIIVDGIHWQECAPPPPPPPPPAVAPRTNLVQVIPSESPVASGEITFEFNSDQLGVTFQCSLDGMTAASCSSPQTYSGLENGSHLFKVVATNSFGMADSVGATYNWVIDRIPPNVSIDNASSLPALSNSSSISVQFSSPDAASFSCSLDEGVPSSCQSPVNYENLGEGVHKVSVWATDAVGNTSASPAVFQWVIDLTSPVTSFVDIQPPESISNAVSKRFVFAASETSSFECSIDHGSFEVCSSPLDVAGLLEGEHSIDVRGTDGAGNLGNTASYTWIVDVTLPLLAVGQFSPAEGISNAKVVSVEFSSDENAVFYCSFDGSDFSVCSSPYSNSILSEGSHEFQVYAQDAAGNASAPADLIWSIDFSAPQISWGALIPSGTYISSSSLSAQVLSAEPTVFSWVLNNLGLNGSGSTQLLQDLGEGEHDLSVTGLDTAQNMSNRLVHSFVVDQTNPVANLQADINGVRTLRTDNRFVFAANEEAMFDCQLDGAGFSSCSSPFLVSGLAEGSHLFSVRAKDLAGNLSEVVSVEWEVDLTLPTLSIAANQTGSFSYSFTLSADEEVQGMECSLDGQVFASCSSPVSYSALSVGAHNFSARAIDVAGNTGPASSLTFAITNPVTTQIVSMNPSAPITNITSMSIGFSSNFTGASFVCSWDGEASTPCTSPASRSGLADGNHSFKVWAMDSAGNIDPNGASYSWSVDTVPPVISNLTATVTSTSMTITWVTNKPATSKLNWGPGTTLTRVVAEDSVFKTSHSIRVLGLLPNTVYSYQVSGHSKAGTAYSSTARQTRTSP
jgi:large repetitive protein